MDDGGLLITLDDAETLQLYLDRGLYGERMPPEDSDSSLRDVYYQRLAAYATAREGKHVFFLVDRAIYYGGQIIGADDYGAFYLNGELSPLGRRANASLVWDESERNRYDKSKDSGRFDTGNGESCQPFLVRFRDRLDMAGRYIISDQFYFELSEYLYPLPSNSTTGAGFCTLTPAETHLLLDLLENESEKKIEPVSDEPVSLSADPVPFEPEYGIGSPSEARTPSHLEASLIANPYLLPEQVQPRGATICRQVPVSPFRPTEIDRASICYFSDYPIRDGTIPNTILEPNTQKAGKPAAVKVKRFLKWLKVIEVEIGQVAIHVYAPGYTSTFDRYLPDKLLGQVQKHEYTDE